MQQVCSGHNHVRARIKRAILRPAHTPENIIALYHKNASVNSDPWVGAAPNAPKLPTAKAIPVRALIMFNLNILTSMDSLTRLHLACEQVWPSTKRIMRAMRQRKGRIQHKKQSRPPLFFWRNVY